MAAAANGIAVASPGLENEFGELLVRVADLPPAVRLALARVTESLLADGDLGAAEVPAELLLEALVGRRAGTRFVQAA